VELCPSGLLDVTIMPAKACHFRKEQQKTLNTMTAAELIGQTHPEALTPMRKEDNSRVVDSRILTAIIIGSLFGFALWVGVILLFLGCF
jgi:hypothetical protein